MLPSIALPPGKKIFFASDFHLGVPDHKSSVERERKIIRWLESIEAEAHTIFLLGDIFDFWFEYRHTVPKGHVRLLGKLAQLRDTGVSVIFFTGNHDMWMFDYFEKELDIPVYREPQVLLCGNHRFMIGHGDGLGPGDKQYKLLKRVFSSRVCQWLFGWLHPNIGIGIANRWSRNSRISNNKKGEKFRGEDREFLLIFCREIEKKQHHDYYIFGHRHLPLNIRINDTSRYVNLGEWVNFTTYASYDGESLQLKEFDKNANAG